LRAANHIEELFVDHVPRDVKSRIKLPQ
jgi:hypothetical protein